MGAEVDRVGSGLNYTDVKNIIKGKKMNRGQKIHEISYV